MPGRQQPAVLLKKARDDEGLVRDMLAHDLGTDEQFGFVCQQSVEKAIKAVFEQRGIAYRYTHDLAELLDGLDAAGIDCPSELGASTAFTAFAGPLRYDELPTHATAPESLDRPDGRGGDRVGIHDR